MLSDRDVESARDRALEQQRRALWIIDYCKHLRVERTRQAADLAALVVMLRRSPASRMTSRGR